LVLRPRSERVFVDAFCVAGGWPLPQRFRRSWCRSNLGFASPTETHCRFVRSVSLLAGPEGPAFCVLDYSLGVHQRSPLRQYRCRASSPGRAEARPSARSCHAPSTFRPCRSSRLRRFTPLDTQQVCCTLHPAMGFATFPVGFLSFARGLGTRGWPSPVAPHPSKLSPSQQVAARHRASIPSRRCSWRPTSGPPVLPRLGPGLFPVRSTSGPCSVAKSVASLPALPLASCPMLPWAWSQAGSSMPWLPPPLRGVVGGWPRFGPRTSAGLARESGRFVGLPEGGSGRRPGSDLSGGCPRAPAVRAASPLRGGATRPSSSRRS
jgi:hypothetical protein